MTRLGMVRAHRACIGLFTLVFAGSAQGQSVARVYCGTQDDNGAKVYQYVNGRTWINLTPAGGFPGAKVVMDLAWLDGYLYAGMRCQGNNVNEGQVWRYDPTPPAAWQQVGVIDESVMVLEVMDGQLYAGTRTADGWAGLYRYVPGSPPSWDTLAAPVVQSNGFRSGIASRICSSPDSPSALYLGDLGSDSFYRYDPATGNLDQLDQRGGSCIWDFASYNGNLYAGAYGGSFQGPVYRMAPGSCGNRTPCRAEHGLPCPWFSDIQHTGGHNWAVEVFRNKLYVGSGETTSSSGNPVGAKLRTYDPNDTPQWNIVLQQPTTVSGEGISALAAQGDLCLYIGTGAPEGESFGLADGQAAVWRYDGTRFELVSSPDQFGGAVQCLLVVGEYTDCDGNGQPDQTQQPPLADCDSDGIPDACEVQDDCDGDGVPEECDQTIIDCNQNGVPDECDIQWQISEDCNGNHIPDKCEISVESTAPSGGPFFCTTNCDPDCNNNGMPDACEDCNGNGRADECDILDGVSLDLNGNRIPDECDPDPIIIYVDDRNTGPQTGESWSMAFRSPQGALALARTLSGLIEIHVAEGIYRPTESANDPEATFMLDRALRLFGGYAGLGIPANPDLRSPSTYVTTLSGDVLENDGAGFSNRADNVYHVVTIMATTVLVDGFTIRGGHAVDPSANQGGGIFMTGATPSFSNCTITDNDAVFGGGTYSYGSSPVFKECSFIGNKATANGGGLMNESMMNPNLTPCDLVNTIFSGNTAAQGAGISVLDSYLDRAFAVINCTFTANRTMANGTGGAIACGAPYSDLKSVLISNCVLWSDEAQIGSEIAITDGNLAMTVRYSDVEGGVAGVYVASGSSLAWGDGNLPNDSQISSPPLFMRSAGPGQDGTWGTADDDYGNLRLASDSPCMDTGNNAAVPPYITTDRDGAARIWNGGGAPIVDMGAYERSLACLTAAVSRKRHVGNNIDAEFDIDLLQPITGDMATECRVDGPTKIIVTFSEPVYAAGTPAVAASSGTVSSVAIEDRVLTILMSLAANADRLIVTFPGIVNLYGYPVQSQLCFGVLLGDVNGDKKVQLGDLVAIRDNMNAQPNNGTFRADVNCDGKIQLGDMVIVRDTMNAEITGSCAGYGGCGSGSSSGGSSSPEGGASMLAAGRSGSGEMLSSSAFESSIETSSIFGTEAVQEALTTGASAALVVHGTGAGSVNLPATGGRIVVDLVLTSDQAVEAFTTYPVVDQSGAISLVADGWTAKGNLLTATGTVGAPATGYTADLMDWYVLAADGSSLAGTDVAQAAAADAGQIVAFVGELGALAGPMSTPKNGVFAGSAPLWLVARQPFGPGSTVVATLVLDVAGGNGVYHLGLADGQYTAPDGVTRSLTSNSVLEIRVDGR